MAPEASWPALDLLFASHPWHGVAIGPDAPWQVTACELTRVYGREEAFEVIRRSQADYQARFGETLGPLLAKG